MKKLITAILLFLPTIIFANAINIDSITSSSGYYSFKLALYPHDKNHADGVPMSLGAGFLNRYLTGVSPDDHSYLEFGFYNYLTQQTTWFPDTCKIILSKDGDITVDIHSTQCSYTYTTGLKSSITKIIIN